jgi:formylglycine-generating enzyme required for sulfatase activity
MKSLLYPILFLLLIVLFGFSLKPKYNTPPGTVKINDTLYFDKAEISNFSYFEYLESIKNVHGINSSMYTAALPDTLVWRNPESYNEPYTLYYFRHPAYRNYPVVGISYEQALSYCEWRSKTVNGILKTKNKNFTVTYRLPSLQEWQMVTNNDVDFNHPKKVYNINLQNVKPIHSKKNSNLYSDVTVPTQGLYPNKKGLYNCIGNVAEMTSQKNVCFGGSWRQTKSSLESKLDTVYMSSTSAWIGFRCVCITKAIPR